jgi:hypothetical protein
MSIVRDATDDGIRLTMNTCDLGGEGRPRLLERFVHSGWSYFVVNLLILLLDLLTGKYLLFPVLFIIPVTLSAWYYSAKWAYFMAVVLPIGRSLIVEFAEQTHPTLFNIANAAIRMAVLLLLAFLVDRVSQQTRQLKKRVEELVKVCAWSRTVEYQGEWISFEAYLKRRFNLDTTHGMAPAEAERFVIRSIPAADKPTPSAEQPPPLG